MQDSGCGLWSQDLCSDTINSNVLGLWGRNRYAFLTSYLIPGTKQAEFLGDYMKCKTQVEAYGRRTFALIPSM